MDNNSYLYPVNTTSFKDSELSCLKSGFFFLTDIIDITNADDRHVIIFYLLFVYFSACLKWVSCILLFGCTVDFNFVCCFSF